MSLNKQFLPKRAQSQILLHSKDYIKDHKWAILMHKSIADINQPLDNPRTAVGGSDFDTLETEDKVFALMVMTRLDSFRRKYCLSDGSDLDHTQLIYAVAMMLSNNKKERLDALKDAQEFVESEQKRKLGENSL